MQVAKLKKELKRHALAGKLKARDTLESWTKEYKEKEKGKDAPLPWAEVPSEQQKDAFKEAHDLAKKHNFDELLKARSADARAHARAHMYARSLARRSGRRCCRRRRGRHASRS